MFEGTLLECISAFRQQVLNGDAVMAKFCGVTPSTVATWSKTEPRGRSLNKLCVLLRYHGFIVSKYAKLSKVVVYVQTLVALEVLSTDQACAMGLGKTEQHLWRALQGKIVPYVIRRDELTLDFLRAAYDDELQENISIFRLEGLLPKEGEVAVKKAPGPTHPTPQPLTSNSALRDAALVAAGHLLAGTPSLEVLAAAGPEGKLLLEEIIGQERFWRTLDMLKAMSSRQAHKFFQGGGSANG